MPGMDGLEATTLIRSREKGHGSHVPIIAMTAHAMKGDKESCLGAGMDGYLSKPVNQQHLYREIARVVNAGAASGRQDQARPPSSPPQPGREPAPAEVAPDRRDRRRQRMLELFRAEGPNMLAEIRAAVAAADAARLARAAHKFCGAVSYLAAPDAEVAGRRLETLGRETNLSPAPAALAHLEECLARFDPTLAAACGIATPQAAAPAK